MNSDSRFSNDFADVFPRCRLVRSHTWTPASTEEQDVAQDTVATTTSPRLRRKTFRGATFTPPVKGCFTAS